MNFSKVRSALVAALKEDLPSFADMSQLPNSTQVQYAVLSDLAISSNREWNSNVMKLFDEAWRSQLRRSIRWTDIPHRAVFGGRAEIAV
jgi:hypothetical protein